MLENLDFQQLDYPHRLESFIHLDTEQNDSNSVSRLSLVSDQIYMNGDDFGSKFTYAPIWGRGAEELKLQELFIFKPSKVV